MTRKAQLHRQQKEKRKREDNIFKRHKSKRQIVPRRSSRAKKQRCEGSTSATTQPSSVAEVETDPRSIIKSYEYDPVDEKEYEAWGRFGKHMATAKELHEHLRQVEESDVGLLPLAHNNFMIHSWKYLFVYVYKYPTIEALQGFDVMHFPKTFFGAGAILPILDLRESADKLKSLSELALGQYNAQQGSKLKFVKIVKANSVACAGRRYFITFDAEDASAGDGCTSTYQAEVWHGFSKITVRLMRPKKQGNLAISMQRTYLLIV
ncbi:hypothetical protein Vadar_000386 [Vaccinium darrowii]|uniref:Uncharacterized protein n=1 Tax=Vaccinium darrowii TaxID=229202 RepID=A0ACB7XWY9_9ERIC|nr:hypothetical protein Vadar_000386 [Vaccinium darrowii]